MKVKELIEELQKYNPELEVIFNSCIKDTKKFAEFTPVPFVRMHDVWDQVSIYLGKPKKEEKKKINI
ncbi:hypothetical protein FV113G1_20330 [Fusobacterium varium]|nr:hypothetical protein FV113G1_20330 [Fusobacterium varium]